MVGKESKKIAGEEAQDLMFKVSVMVERYTNGNLGVLPLKFLKRMITIEQSATKINHDIGDWLARMFEDS